MSTHVFFYLVIGLALLGLVFLPRLLNDRLLSIPMVYVLYGMIIFSLPIEGLPTINPNVDEWDGLLMEYISEFIVIISLVATGIKIDRRPSWKNWKVAWYLLALAMPLCIGAVAGLGWALMGLAPAAAVLLGAVLAPTDPVLAGSVQVGPPGEGNEDEVRYSLTLEAGLNDGLAFPFVYLAIALVGVEALGQTLWQWFSWDFLYRIAAGTAIGFVVGRWLPPFFFRKAEKIEQEPGGQFQEGIFIVGATVLTYALAELVHGYGFLAVFVAAVVGRNVEAEHELHKRNYQAIDQIEQAVLAAFLIGFGGMLVRGIFDELTWMGALVGTLLVLVVRPLIGLLSLLTYRINWAQKLAISFFGIRGVGSIYYLAFAQGEEKFSQLSEVWATVAFTILLSIVIHGASVRPLLAWVDKKGETN